MLYAQHEEGALSLRSRKLGSWGTGVNAHRGVELGGRERGGSVFRDGEETQGQAAYASKADLRVLSYNTYYVFSHGSEIAAATGALRL